MTNYYNFSPVIFGIEGFSLKKEEINFFQKVNPLGFILFKRNVDNPKQLLKLTDSLKECLGRDCPILIDQEGGRVARLQEPHWPKFPAMAEFAKLADGDLENAIDKCFQNAVALGKTLKSSGINVNCSPVCDVYYDYADKIIGDRSFGANVDIITKLAQATIDGLESQNVMPIIKHIPGHGRALCDSHLELPVVNCLKDDLEQSDFLVFENLSNASWAMTAHVVYNCLDSENCVTQSKDAIQYIRQDIGFKGLLVSDDLSMQALKGDYSIRARLTLEAGCDIILHCNGNMEQMQEIAKSLPKDADVKTKSRFFESFNKICVSKK